MNSAASNICKKSVQALTGNLILKNEIFNRKTHQGFDSLFIRSNNKPTSVVNVDKPVNVETPKKYLNITSLKTLTNLDKFTPNYDIVTETPALKDNSGSKLNFNISKNVTKSSDSSSLPDIRESNKSVHEVSPVTYQRSAFSCSDYVRKEMFDTFYKDYLEFKYYMNDIIKTMTTSSEFVTNLSNDNDSLETKINSLEEEIKSLKNKNSNLKGNINTQLKVIESQPRFENRHCKDSVTNKEKVNVNYKSDNHKNEIHCQITTSRDKHGNSTNKENNTLERNIKSNDIHFELSNWFAPLHNDDQNLTTKRPTSTIPKIPEKIPANSRNTSPHATNTVRNKRSRIISKISNHFTILCHYQNLGIIKNGRKVLVMGDSHVKEMISTKNFKMVELLSIF